MKFKLGMSTRRVLLATLGLSLCVLPSCKHTCEELKSKYVKELAEIRTVCDCSFSIECDPAFNGGPGATGFTVKDAAGNVLITLPGGSETVRKETLRHELVHAVDKCSNFCDSSWPTPPGLAGTPGELIFMYRRLILCEFLAYRLTDDFVIKNLPGDRFPDADDDDRAIDSAYRSVGSQLTGLTQQQTQLLNQALHAGGIHPDQVRADNPNYGKLKTDLIAELNRFRNSRNACLEKIIDI